MAFPRVCAELSVSCLVESLVLGCLQVAFPTWMQLLALSYEIGTRKLRFIFNGSPRAHKVGGGQVNNI